VSEAAFPVEPAGHRHPRLGYLMAASAGVLWGVNGAVSKTILASGMSSERLAQVRSLGAAIGLVAILALTAPGRLRLTRRELPYLVVFGIGGLAFVQFFYFLAIHRLAIGIALLVEYLAPLLVALWARFAQHAHVRRRIWVALALALTGLGLIVDVVGGGSSLSTAGLAFALGGAFAYALYVLLAEHVVEGRDPVSLLAWGFLFASLFWAVVVPWWSFSGGSLTKDTSLGGHLATHHLPVWVLALWMVVLGTIVPFFLLISALRHLPATTVGIVAMIEPVVGALVGWVWLGESLSGVQLAGAAVVLAAILLAQTARE
jgi:drug/metabolite transporter (DMT)-like permease